MMDITVAFVHLSLIKVFEKASITRGGAHPRVVQKGFGLLIVVTHSLTFLTVYP